MKRLQSLRLAQNEISDISGLANLTGVEDINLYGNQISDLTPLANVTGTRYLQLHENLISDIAPLVNMTGLSDLQLNSNPLSTSAESIIQILEDRGVDVEYDSISAPIFVDIPDFNLRIELQSILSKDSEALISTAELLAITGDLNLQIGNLGGPITDLSGLEYITNVTALFLGGNAVSNLEPISGLSNLYKLDLSFKYKSG